MVSDLVVEGLTVKFNDYKALDNISFRLDSPFFTVVMGPNGAGKTTLLKSILGLVKPSLGMIRVYGLDPFREANKIRQIVSYVPQVVNINIHVPITVREVIAMGIYSKSIPPRIMNKEIEEEVEEVLRLVELERYSRKWFTELSGGERQRVLIARAMVKGAKLLLLDEPFSMLDFDIKCEIAKLLDRIHYRMNIDILLVAHELSPCIAYNPQVILLNKKVYAVGRAGEVLRLEILKRAYPGITEIPQGFIIGEDHA
ncbi:MAG: ATP-binding cassette domain-containing protein [Aigarchaeota archaeon]|nr:ATP-binding cassette domain-containing protein [Aigarchaeota archaeon]MCX8193242.1 ATP-binding cassette domain-containing protein [Nitrososphaeria archaeon]MDW7986382.1 ATP-binding cassette domain-containing protein [Nitrososphaerota archaeon]